MTTPNPRGTVRDTFWDKMALAKRQAQTHWFWKPARKAKRARMAELLARV